MTSDALKPRWTRRRRVVAGVGAMVGLLTYSRGGGHLFQRGTQTLEGDV